MNNCEKCGSLLIELPGKYVCSSEDCDFQLLFKNMDSTTNEKWYIAFCKDRDFWYHEAFQSFPSILSHEYARLYQLLEAGQTYGAVLQLKDVLEVLIKFPMLIGASYVFSKKERGDIENKLLISLMEKPLSLGDWERISSQLVKLDWLDVHVKDILLDILSLYRDKKNNIVHWRNTQIGHGALAFDTDGPFQMDVKSKLQLIKGHMERQASNYKKIVLFIENHDEKLLLMGKDLARNLSINSGPVYAMLGQSVQNLFPYITIYDHGIFFFDSYHVRQKKSAFLNYPEGVKQDTIETINHETSRLYSALSHYTTQISGDSYLEEESYVSFEAKILEKLQEIEDFQRPEHIENWLNEQLKTHTKGVFLLKMERGTGKTTFSRALDEQSIHKISLPDFSVRSYYINDSFLYKPQNFLLKMTDYLRQNPKGEYIIEGINGVSEDTKNPKQAVADLLKKFRSAHEKYFGKKRLLFIIDGLDEIRFSENSIFDYIPEPDQLEENIFLLLTTRTEGETTDFTSEKIGLLPVTSQIEWTRKEKEPMKTLQSFIAKDILHQNSSNEKLTAFIQEIMEIADYRLIYAKTIKSIFQMNPNLELSEIPKGSKLLPFYLSGLEHLYGSKYFRNVLSIVLSLATTFEELTLPELAFLIGEDKPTYKLLANLIDLRIFLKMERSSRGNLLSLSHANWREELVNQYQNEIQHYVQNIMKRAGSVMNSIPEHEWHKKENDGVSYVLANMYEYAREYLPTQSKEWLTKELAIRLTNVSESMKQYAAKEYQKIRIVDMFYNSVEIMKRYHKGRSIENKVLYAETLSTFGEALSSLVNLHKEAIHYLDKSVKLAKEAVLEDISHEVKLGNILLNRGKVYQKLEFTNKALNDIQEAIEIFDACKNQHGKSQLARAYLYQGEIYLDHLYDAHAASEAIQISLNYMSAIKNKWEYAQAYKAIARVFQELSMEDKALEYYKAALKYEEHLYTKDLHPFPENYPLALLNLGEAYKERTDFSEQHLEYYHMAVDTLKTIQQRDMLFNDYVVVQVIYKRGKAYLHQEKIEPALADFNEAIDMCRKLLHEDKWVDRKELVQLLVDRSEIYTQLHQYINAMLSLIEARTMMENIAEKDDRMVVIHINGNLAKLYFYYFEDYYLSYLSNKKAISYLQHDGTISSDYYFASLYSIQAEILYASNQFELALNYAENTLDFLLFIKSREPLKDNQFLAITFALCGNCNYALKDHAKAHEYYLKADAIFEELHKNGKLLITEAYAINLIYCGYLYYCADKFSQAISYYTNALQLNCLADVQSINCYALIGHCFDEMEEYDRAVENYTHSIDLLMAQESHDYEAIMEYLNYRYNSYLMNKDDFNAVRDINEINRLKKRIKKDYRISSKETLEVKQ